MAVRLSALCAWYLFLSKADSSPKTIVQLEGLGQPENLMTSMAMEPVTFQFVTQCLTQLCYHVVYGMVLK
jgi:hypothetical protein